jgi:hypothetical protein
MGLENLKSVFNDLSENQISNPSKLTPHASRLDDIEYNLISDPNSGAGMLHGILTGGDQYVFELPNPPDKKPLTGRDTSDYNDILNHSTIDPKSGLHSPVSDMSKNSSNFQYYSPFPTLDGDFQNASIRLLSGQSLIEDDKHTFGTKGAHDKLIKINRIEKLQDPSPLHDMTHDPGIINNPYIISEEDIKVREGDLFQNLGANNRLGEGDFNWTSLYNANHTPIEERTPIDIGRVDKDGNAILINTLRSGMGSFKYMDIKASGRGFRQGGPLGFGDGREPYIVNEIGSSQWPLGHDRDVIPYQATLQDVSRLAKFYTSTAGIAFIGKDILYGAAFAGPFSIAPLPTNFGEYSGGSEGVVIGRQLMDTLNTGRLLSHIMVPPFPTPNTGLLSLAGSTLAAKKPGISSLRKPFAIDYSALIRTNPIISKIEQLAGSKRLLDIENKQPYEDTAILLPIPRNKEYSKRTPKSLQEKSGIDEPNAPAFLGLGSNPKHSAVDNIAASPVISGSSTSTAPLEDKPYDIQKGDFYVRIKDLRDNTFIYFRGFVTGITENVNPSFTPTNYIGRSEPVYVYERGERDLSFNLRVYPNNEEHFTTMYEKIEKLTSLAYPEYFPNDPGASLVRMKAPFTELYMAHIGSRAKGQFGFIKSISYTVNESGDWDSKTLLPKLFDIAISYQILNRKPPSGAGINKSQFYRVSV